MKSTVQLLASLALEASGILAFAAPTPVTVSSGEPTPESRKLEIHVHSLTALKLTTPSSLFQLPSPSSHARCHPTATSMPPNGAPATHPLPVCDALGTSAKLFARAAVRNATTLLLPLSIPFWEICQGAQRAGAMRRRPHGCPAPTHRPLAQPLPPG